MPSEHGFPVKVHSPLSVITERLQIGPLGQQHRALSGIGVNAVLLRVSLLWALRVAPAEAWDCLLVRSGPTVAVTLLPVRNIGIRT